MSLDESARRIPLLCLASQASYLRKVRGQMKEKSLQPGRPSNQSVPRLCAGTRLPCGRRRPPFQHERAFTPSTCRWRARLGATSMERYGSFESRFMLVQALAHCWQVALSVCSSWTMCSVGLSVGSHSETDPCLLEVQNGAVSSHLLPTSVSKLCLVFG